MSSTAAGPADAGAPPEVDPAVQQAQATMRSRRFLVLLVLVSIIGVVVSLAAWCFLELIHQIQQELFTHLPHALGYPNGPPVWWPLPVLAIGAVIVAVAIEKLPGKGGHIPANGLAAGGLPVAADLPGVLLAAFATIGFGLVLGPEAPLIALGAGLGAIAIRALRSDSPNEVVGLVAAAGSFAAVSLIFGSPVIAAVLMIEVSGIGGARLPLLLIPGLLAAGIGSLVSIGMGSFTGLSTSAYAISALPTPQFSHPHVGNFAWSIALALAIAVGAHLLVRGGLLTLKVVTRRPFLLLPLAALVIAGLAIAFSQITGKSVNEVLFDGQDQLPGLVGQASAYSVGTLALLLLCKGLAYSLSLGSYRGGPTFPAMFLGATAGIMASHLPGFPLDAGVAVGLAAGVASVLKLPLTAIIIGVFLTDKSGTGVEPLVIVGTVVAYIATLWLTANPIPLPGAARPSRVERPAEASP